MLQKPAVQVAAVVMRPYRCQVRQEQQIKATQVLTVAEHRRTLAAVVVAQAKPDQARQVASAGTVATVCHQASPARQLPVAVAVAAHSFSWALLVLVVLVVAVTVVLAVSVLNRATPTQVVAAAAQAMATQQRLAAMAAQVSSSSATQPPTRSRSAQG